MSIVDTTRWALPAEWWKIWDNGRFGKIRGRFGCNQHPKALSRFSQTVKFESASLPVVRK